MDKRNKKDTPKSYLKLRIAVSLILTAAVLLGKYVPHESLKSLRDAIYYTAKKDINTGDIAKYISDAAGRLR